MDAVSVCFYTSLVLLSSGLASFPGKIPPSDKKDSRHT